VRVWCSSLLAVCAVMPAPVDTGRFPAPERGLTLTWEGTRGPSMRALLGAFAHATGSSVLYSSWSGTKAIIRDMKELDVPGEASRLDVPADEVYFEFERLLRANDFVLVRAFSGERSAAVRVLSLQTQERNDIKRHAFYEPVETIELYRRHPAVLVTTYLPLSAATDPRLVANELRRSLTDANIQQVIPAGPGLVLTGFGPLVCELVDFLREIDARNAAGDTVDQETLEALRLERFPPETEEPR